MLDPPLPEIALVGRSNVGKSSLLNALAGTGIARTSATPGKTRMLNVFQMTDVLSVAYYLLDLPGYGYSRASHVDRRAFRLLITHALNRPRLTGVLWLLDVRHEPSTDDHAMQELFADRDTRVLAAFTKSDKLSRAERQRREGELGKNLGLDKDQVVVTSAREGGGIGELRDAVRRLVG